MTLQGLDSIFGTGWQMAAIGAQKWRNEQPVEPEHKAPRGGQKTFDGALQAFQYRHHDAAAGLLPRWSIVPSIVRSIVR